MRTLKTVAEASTTPLSLIVPKFPLNHLSFNVSRQLRHGNNLKYLEAKKSLGREKSEANEKVSYGKLTENFMNRNG